MNIQNPHISIIGCGQLGSRHLQGLKNINREIDVSIVEPDSSAREIAKNRFDEMLPNDSLVKSVKYLADIAQLPKHIDVAIIATNADIRRHIVEQVINISDVSSMILEKVVFQSVDDFHSVIELLKGKDIKAWVNCTRRMFPIYKEIRKTLEHQKKISLHVHGKNWGMGCNSIHHIDLFAYLTGLAPIDFEISGMDKEIYKNKRDGFVEFGGYLTGKTSRGDSINIVDYKTEGSTTISLHIVSDEYEFLIHEVDKIILKSKKENNWKVVKSGIDMPYQSELTHTVVQQILDGRTCELTLLEESYEFHKPMFEAFNNLLNASGRQNNGICPIT